MLKLEECRALVKTEEEEEEEKVGNETQQAAQPRHRRKFGVRLAFVYLLLSTLFMTMLVMMGNEKKLPQVKKIFTGNTTLESKSANITAKGNVTDGVNSLSLIDTSSSYKGEFLPSWSNFPRTRFTNRVLGIIGSWNMSWNPTDCFYSLSVIVPTPYSTPVVECSDDSNPTKIRCDFMTHIFQSRVMAYNVTIGFEIGDETSEEKANSACFVSSSPGGKHGMTDSCAMEQMNKRYNQYHDSAEWRTSIFYANKPWQERSSTPVFRGSAWRISGNRLDQLCNDPNATSEQILAELPERFRAVDFSYNHPDLLDAKFSSGGSFDCKEHNDSISHLATADSIRKNEYYSNYQVALVLRGIGAAFRLQDHLMTRTAVVLQDYGKVLWYTPYLKPYVHYIPLSEDLHDLEEVLLWVRDNPEKVKEIADNGRAFYDKYLTYHQSEEHFYELAYRLSEYFHFKKADPEDYQSVHRSSVNNFARILARE